MWSPGYATSPWCRKELEAITVLALAKRLPVACFESPAAFFAAHRFDPRDAGYTGVGMERRDALPCALPPQLERWAGGVDLAAWVVQLDLEDAWDAVLRRGTLRHLQAASNGEQLRPGRGGALRVSDPLEGVGPWEPAAAAFLSGRYIVQRLTAQPGAAAAADGGGGSENDGGGGGGGASGSLARQLRALGALLLLQPAPDVVFVLRDDDARERIGSLWLLVRFDRRLLQDPEAEPAPGREGEPLVEYRFFPLTKWPCQPHLANVYWAGTDRNLSDFLARVDQRNAARA